MKKLLSNELFLDLLHKCQNICFLGFAISLLVFFTIMDIFHISSWIVLSILFVCLGLFLLIGIFWFILDIVDFSQKYKKIYEQENMLKAKDNESSNLQSTIASKKAK